MIDAKKNKKRKLLMFHPIIAPYRIDMVNELAEYFELTVCLFLSNLLEQKFDIERLYKERLKITPEYLFEKTYDGKQNINRAVIESIETHNPDIVLVSEFSFYVWLIIVYRMLHKSHFKIVSMVDDSMYLIEHKYSIFIKHSIARLLTMPFVDEIITVDPRATEWYQQNYGKGVFYPIVNNDVRYRTLLKRVMPMSEQYINRYQLYGKRVLLFVGRLSEEKNIPMAIEAFLRANISNSIFIIIGDGPEKSSLLRRYGEEQSVMFLGRYEGDSLYAWYNVGQVFILPSIREAFGAVTNEALLAGCYSLVSERAGSCCLIMNDKNGNVFSPDDIEMQVSLLTEALGRMRPLSSPLQVKPDNMPYTFNEYMSKLVAVLSVI